MFTCFASAVPIAEDFTDVLGESGVEDLQSLRKWFVQDFQSNMLTDVKFIQASNWEEVEITELSMCEGYVSIWSQKGTLLVLKAESISRPEQMPSFPLEMLFSIDLISYITYSVLGRLLTNCSLLLIRNYMLKIVFSDVIKMHLLNLGHVFWILLDYCLINFDKTCLYILMELLLFF